MLRLRNDELDGNWAGYAVTGGPYTAAQGTWKVPAVSYVPYPQAPQVEASSTWVGIDGDGDNPLIQLGSEEDATPKGAIYRIWYEALPAAQTNIDATRFVIAPGDTITASLQCLAPCKPNSTKPPYPKQTWILKMMDVGRWKTPFTVQLALPTKTAYSSTLRSAEWIVEDTCLQCGANPILDYAYLPDYHAVTFTAITVNENQNPNLSRSRDALMVTDPQGKAWSVPSDPVGGNSFAVCFIKPPSPDQTCRPM